MKEHSSEKETQKLSGSFRHAFDGIITTIRAERNMKIHMSCAVLVIFFGLWLELQLWEWLVCISWMTLVIGGELINTAIEAAVDLSTQTWHPLAKLAKDAAAGAVLVFAIGAAVSAAFLFLPKLAARLLPLVS